MTSRRIFASLSAHKNYNAAFKPHNHCSSIIAFNYVKAHNGFNARIKADAAKNRSGHLHEKRKYRHRPLFA